LATGDAWGTVRVFDLFLAHQFVPPGATLARRTALSPDGRFAVLVGQGRQVQLWDITAQRPSGRALTSRGVVAQTLVDPSGRHLAVACGQEGVQVWDLATQRELLDLPDVGAVASIAFNPDGTKLLVALENNSAQIWQLADRRPVGPVMQRTTFTDGRPLKPTWTYGPVGSESTWSPDGRWIVLAGGVNFATVWDARTGLPVGDPLVSDGEVRDVRFSPDGQRLVLAFNDRNVEPAAAQVYALPSLRPLGAPLQHGDGVVAVRFDASGRVLSTAGHDGVVRLWHVADGSPAGPEFRHGGIVIAQNFRRDGSRLATTAADRTVRLWDTGRGELLAPPLALATTPQAVDFSADGETLVFGSARGATGFFRFRPMTWAPDSWRRLAVCLNGVRLDERGQRIRVSPAELAATFAGLQAAQPADFAWNADPTDWHRQCAAAAELQGEWFTAAFHLARLVTAQPDDTEAKARLAIARANVK
jgi:WD40 repeat protein